MEITTNARSSGVNLSTAIPSAVEAAGGCSVFEMVMMKIAPPTAKLPARTSCGRKEHPIPMSMATE